MYTQLGLRCYSWEKLLKNSKKYNEIDILTGHELFSTYQCIQIDLLVGGIFVTYEAFLWP